MKKKLTLILAFLILQISANANGTDKVEEQKRANKNIQEQMKKEEKYALEQKFYSEKDYDFKGAEVDEETVKAIPDTVNTNDDFDMNSVYD
jgi:hypothetical protein